jgi:hypothetical protein
VAGIIQILYALLCFKQFWENASRMFKLSNMFNCRLSSWSASTKTPNWCPSLVQNKRDYRVIKKSIVLCQDISDIMLILRWTTIHFPLYYLISLSYYTWKNWNTVLNLVLFNLHVLLMGNFQQLRFVLTGNRAETDRKYLFII